MLQAAPVAVAPPAAVVPAPAPAPAPSPSQATPPPSATHHAHDPPRLAHGPPREFLEVAASAPLAIVAVPRVVDPAVSVAVEFGRAGSGWAGTIAFNIWLRRQLRERRMSQRQLAAYSGVDHSTISRLLSGDRTPSLDTATRLAHTLRKLGGFDTAADYFDRQADMAVFPTKRVEAALLADDELDDEDVRELMQAYLVARARRRRLRAAAAAASRDDVSDGARTRAAPVGDESATPAGSRGSGRSG
jgi:transcriptional regulator with XRE-family HTH domain